MNANNGARQRLAVVALALTLVASACGGGDDTEADAETGPGDEAELGDSTDGAADDGPDDDSGVEPEDGGKGDDADAATDGTDSGSDSADGTDGDAATDDGDPGELDLPAEFAAGLPAGGRWGVLDITVERFILDRIDPSSLIATTPRESEEANIFVEVTIENTHGVRPQSVDNRTFSIRLADGTEIRAVDVDRDLRSSVGALLAVRGLVGFAPLDPVTSLAGATLVVGVDEIPLEIGEDGTVTGTPDPVELDVDGSGDSLGVEIGACVKPITSTITGARLQIDSGLTTTEDVRDIDLDSHRAPSGQVFFVLDYDAYNAGGGIICGGSGGAPRVRLLVDGTPLVPQWASTWQNPAGTTTPSQSGWLMTPDPDASLELVFGIDETWSVSLDPAAVFAEIPA